MLPLQFIAIIEVRRLYSGQFFTDKVCLAKIWMKCGPSVATFSTSCVLSSGHWQFSYSQVVSGAFRWPVQALRCPVWSLKWPLWASDQGRISHKAAVALGQQRVEEQHKLEAGRPRKVGPVFWTWLGDQIQPCRELPW